MRMAVLQHVPFEGPAAIADWAAAHGADLTISHLYRGDPLPAMADFDMLAVMGGPMSANDEAQYAWLTPEIALVRDAIERGQDRAGRLSWCAIIAKALGAKVYAGKHKEIGWFEAGEPRPRTPSSMGSPPPSPRSIGTVKPSICPRAPCG